MAAESADVAERRTVEAAQSGDESAWRALFDAHYERLALFFQWRVPSDEDAEDLAAEVFIHAYRGLSKFQWRKRPFGAWLFAIARNRLATYYRRRKVTEELKADVPYRRDDFVSTEVHDILAQLPEDYRMAIELRYLLGLSGAEAAAAMGKSHGAFRALLHRATAAFRGQYEDEGELDAAAA